MMDGMGTNMGAWMASGGLFMLAVPLVLVGAGLVIGYALGRRGR